MNKQLTVVTLALALAFPALGYATAGHNNPGNVMDYLDLPIVTHHEAVRQTSDSQYDYAGLPVVIASEKQEPVKLKCSYSD